jgi:gas vesicle protein
LTYSAENNNSFKNHPILKRRNKMSDHDDFGAFLIGFIVGGVAGAVAALLLAPQSGEETRALIKDKSIELRDKAAEQAEMVASRANEFADDAKTRGKEVFDDAKTRGKEAFDNVKKTVTRKRPATSAGE